MTIDDEKFFAWLDGELDAEQAVEVAAAVAADPRLAAIAEEHRAFGSRLRASFDTVAAADVPERLRDSARAPGAKVINLGAHRARKAWGAVPQWAAIAATLVAGVFLGTGLNRRDGSPVELRGGAMVAAARLDDALDRQLASQGEVGGVRIGVSFRDHAGAVCRSFTDQKSSGLACRAGNEWRVKGLFAVPEAQGGDFRMAAGADPNLAALIDSTIAGDAFDAAEEKSARDRRWR
jgi:hypothetical protein